IVSRTSPGLSSTSKISTGRPSSAVLMTACLLGTVLRCWGVTVLGCWLPIQHLTPQHRNTALPRNREKERRPLPRLPLDPDAAAVALHDPLADRQADARAGVLGAAVQPLEDEKDPLAVLRLDADAVIPHGEEPLRPLGRG